MEEYENAGAPEGEAEVAEGGPEGSAEVAKDTSEVAPGTSEMPPEASEANYLRDTVVQPKPVDQAITHQGTECSSIIKAFSNCSFSGIRSLPNNIHPDFRQETFQRAGKLSPTRTSAAGGAASPTKDRDSDKAHSSSFKFAKGQRRRQRYGGMPQTFTSYEYMSDPVQDKLAKRREEVSKGKEKWLSTDDFKTCALPRVHKSMGLIDRYTYSISPYENTEEEAKRVNRETKQKILHGPVRAGGCVNQGEKAKIRLKELIKSLARLLKKDWPEASIDTFVDDAGCIVVSFAKEEGLSMRHVMAYMNRFAKANATVHEFKLKKDATRWGYTEDDLDNTFFVLCPPWIHLKQAPLNYRSRPGGAGSSHDLALDSGRIPFGPQSAHGNPIQVHVRNLAYAFKT